MRRLKDLQIQVNGMEHRVEETMAICDERVKIGAYAADRSRRKTSSYNGSYEKLYN